MEIQNIDFKSWKIKYNESEKQFLPKDYFIDSLFGLKYDFILKDDHRSFVAVFIKDGEKLVLKIPREKNKRKWIRFTTLFRSSEAVRNFYEMNNCLKHGILTTTPLMAAEKRECGVIVDSFVIYKFLEGEKIEEPYYNKVIEKLKEIHKMGFVHGDSQRQNFLVCGLEVGIIDARFKKKRFGVFSEAYELWYLRKSGENLDKYLAEESQKIAFKIIESIQKIIFGFKNFKRKLKGKK